MPGQVQNLPAGDKSSTSSGVIKDTAGHRPGRKDLFQTGYVGVLSPTEVTSRSTASAAPSHHEHTSTTDSPPHASRKYSRAAAPTAQDKPASTQAYHHHRMPQSTSPSPKEPAMPFHHHTMPTSAPPVRLNYDESHAFFQAHVWEGRRYSCSFEHAPLFQPLARRQSDSSVHMNHYAQQRADEAEQPANGAQQPAQDHERRLDAQRLILPPWSSLVASRPRFTAVKEPGAQLAPIRQVLLPPPAPHPPPPSSTDGSVELDDGQVLNIRLSSLSTGSTWVPSPPVGPRAMDLLPPMTPDATIGRWRRDEKASRPGRDSFVLDSPPPRPLPPPEP